MPYPVERVRLIEEDHTHLLSHIQRKMHIVNKIHKLIYSAITFVKTRVFTCQKTVIQAVFVQFFKDNTFL